MSTMFVESSEHRRNGTTRVIGIEIKARINRSIDVECGFWIPERELIIPDPRYAQNLAMLEFPCTIHTVTGDLNYQYPQVR